MRALCLITAFLFTSSVYADESEYQKGCLYKVSLVREPTKEDIQACSEIKNQAGLGCVSFGKDKTVSTVYISKCAEYTNNPFAYGCYGRINNPSKEQISSCMEFVKTQNSLECVKKFDVKNSELIELCGSIENDFSLSCVEEFVSNVKYNGTESSVYMGILNMDGRDRIKKCSSVKSYQAFQCVKMLKDAKYVDQIEECSKINNVFSAGCVAHVLNTHSRGTIKQDILSCAQIETAEAYNCITSLGKEGLASCIKKSEIAVFDESRKAKELSFFEKIFGPSKSNKTSEK
jgi:predicted transcriptional regulator with HTH domain